jgi:hypothetical protein
MHSDKLRGERESLSKAYLFLDSPEVLASIMEFKKGKSQIKVL